MPKEKHTQKVCVALQAFSVQMSFTLLSAVEETPSEIVSCFIRTIRFVACSLFLSRSLCLSLFVSLSLSLALFMRRRASFSVVLTDKFAIETFQQMFERACAMRPKQQQNEKNVIGYDFSSMQKKFSSVFRGYHRRA